MFNYSFSSSLLLKIQNMEQLHKLTTTLLFFTSGFIPTLTSSLFINAFELFIIFSFSIININYIFLFFYFLLSEKIKIDCFIYFYYNIVKIINLINSIKIEFTGNRYGLTEKQKEQIKLVFDKYDYIIASHGDCVGSDTDFHNLCINYKNEHPNKTIGVIIMFIDVIILIIVYAIIVIINFFIFYL